MHAQVMVKLNDSFSGEGNAVLRVDKDLAAAAKERCHVRSCAEVTPQRLSKTKQNKDAFEGKSFRMV